MGNEKGNYDLLMGLDVNFNNEAVKAELNKWRDWYIGQTNVDGFRLDALKHITPSFFNDWIEKLRKQRDESFMIVGEFWSAEVEVLMNYIQTTNGRIQLFDVPLQHKFSKASTSGDSFDMRSLMNDTLTSRCPELSITFVENHDTQPYQSLLSPVEPWFRPMAYAFILLREQGIPCVFYPAVYKASYDAEKNGEKTPIVMWPVLGIEQLLFARQHAAYGKQRDFFISEHTIGWTREGTIDHPNSGLAVLMTNGSGGRHFLEMGSKHAGKQMTNLIGGFDEQVKVDENGWAEFPVKDGALSVWVAEELLEAH
ncbi:MAG: DUF1939 domain-containing protein [Pedobacter sp.]|nr:MAG: DUF1939 domain-containing protein [Pedobacter sp.]